MDSDEDHYSEPSYPPGGIEEEGELSDWVCTKGEDIDQEIIEEANYWEMMRVVRLFMAWHQVLEFYSSSSSLDDNPFASMRI